ncbi:hypothetical protein TRFO_19584 [Tritrichomonas foetus]|uniref:Golgi apparatus membrane protein TVP23 homolog n=1 Tax=Tritrichomonas foetus TaxID=1144522 RepID=A0A1J4KHN5_9EUKA|nr:hypothetical protein TRFO_19584 [Tritrichomonas foetus]|eukprot:OHT10911.1 hypothetical protein TRFO_19584 [Tritrichomonas foetus]
MANQSQSSQDTDKLIKQDESKGTGSSIGLYLVTRFTPVILCFIFISIHFNFVFSAFILSILGLFDFLLTKNYFGIGLVGLKWYFSSSEAPKFPYIVFFSRPLPFVASTVDSNAFWLGLFVGSGSWIIAGAVGMFIGGTKWFILCIVLLVATLLNFWGFMKCHNLAKLKAEDAARNLLLDTTVTFQAANELAGGDSSSSSSPIEESNNEDEDDEESGNSKSG